MLTIALLGALSAYLLPTVSADPEFAVTSIHSLDDLQPTLNASLQACRNIQFYPTDTANDIVNGVCKPFTLIFARGTTETGNIGNIVGPPFVSELLDRLPGKVAIQGVNNYSATAQEYLTGGSVTGAMDVIALVNQTMSICPSTKLCLSGYSQGAQVIHRAAANFTAPMTDFVNSVVLYGDPFNGTAVGQVPAAKVSVVCHFADDICLDGDIIDTQHLDYCINTPAEADFAVKRSGLAG